MQGQISRESLAAPSHLLLLLDTPGEEKKYLKKDISIVLRSIYTRAKGLTFQLWQVEGMNLAPCMGDRSRPTAEVFFLLSFSHIPRGGLDLHHICKGGRETMRLIRMYKCMNRRMHECTKAGRLSR